MTAYRSLVIAALLGVGIAQKADEDPAPAPQGRSSAKASGPIHKRLTIGCLLFVCPENDGDCEPGYSLMPSGDCRGDPCNVEESVGPSSVANRGKEERARRGAGIRS